MKALLAGCFLVMSCLPGACSTQQAKIPFQPVAQEQDQAMLYLYRPQTMSNAMYHPAVYLDDEQRATISGGQHYLLRVKPGRHTLVLAPEKNYSGHTREAFQATAGEYIYYRIDTRLALSNQSAGYTPYKRSFNLVAVSPDQATAEISQCCNPASNKPENSTLNQTPAEKPATGFSSDKTANPFGH